MKTLLSVLNRHRWVLAGFVLVLLLTAGAELMSGRSPLGPDSRFGIWEGDIWSSENSQRVADAYSFSHFIHGILFYGFLWSVLRRVPVRHRFLIAVVLEACWELLENSPFIINRYREATISLGYVGDSVLNSVSDIVTASLGFLFAWKVRMRTSLIAIVVLEAGCLLWVRDNLTLNVVMLVHPIPAIKQWQSEGHPH
jgi:hypothetical protein